MTGSADVTEIEGGSAWNVIPASCEITVDERTVPDDRSDVGSVTAVDECEWHIDQDLPSMACDDESFAESVLEVSKAPPGPRAPELVTKPHATDAGWLSQAGTTCVVCGAASARHTPTQRASR